MNFQYTNVKVEGPSFPTSRASQLLPGRLFLGVALGGSRSRSHLASPRQVGRLGGAKITFEANALEVGKGNFAARHEAL